MSYILDGNNFEVLAGGKIVQLTAQEFRLMEALHDCHGRVATYDHICQRMWPFGREPEYFNSDIKVYIHRLRKKLSPHVTIETRRGIGYSIRQEA